MNTQAITLLQNLVNNHTMHSMTLQHYFFSKGVQNLQVPRTNSPQW